MDYRKTGEFWMVWNPSGRAPAVRHATEELAEAEAQRLARLCPGQVFIVLKALYGCRAAITPVDRVPLGEIDLVPF